MTDNELIEQIYKILRDVKLGGIDCRVATVIVSDICKAHYTKPNIDKGIEATERSIKNAELCEKYRNNKQST